MIYRSRLQALLFTLFASLLIFSCNQKHQQTYHGNHFEINFFEADTLQQGDWIEIDSLRFEHHRIPKNYLSNPTGLPTSQVLKDSIDADNKFTSQYNSISIAIMFGNKLSKLNKKHESEGVTDSKFIIANPPLLMNMGILTLHKSDSSSFTVKTSENYPATVTVKNI